MSEYDLSKTYIQYNEDILTGKIASSSNIYLACKRCKEWFSRTDIYLDYTEVDKRIKLVSKMKHFSGKCAHQPFILLPYQTWIFANIFGWKYKSTNKRVTKSCLLFISRKNGKSALSAAMAITEMLMGEIGTSIDCVANSGAQARILFNMVKNFSESLDPTSKLFTRYRDTVKLNCNKAEVNVLNSDSMTLDGRSSFMFIEDEFAAAKNWDLYNVMKSSQAYASQPLSICITSANFLLDGYPCYEMRKTCIEILKGNKSDDSQFSALYELDDDDDWLNDESCWVKANPSIEQTVTYEFLRDQITMAKNQPSTEFGVKTKQFNIFCQSNDVWINSKYLDPCFRNLNIEDFKGEYAYGGVDLAAVSDLAAIAILYPPDQSRTTYPDHFVFFVNSYAPESVLEESVNKHLYRHWNKKGFLTLTSGNVTDYSYIQNDLCSINAVTPFASIATDPWNASMFTIGCQNASLPIEFFSQSTGNMNRPVKTLEMLMLQGKVIIQKNDCTRWCFNNATPKYSMNGNVTIDKPTPEAKIDPVIAMVNAIGIYLLNSNFDVSVS